MIWHWPPDSAASYSCEDIFTWTAAQVPPIASMGEWSFLQDRLEWREETYTLGTIVSITGTVDQTQASQEQVCSAMSAVPPALYSGGGMGWLPRRGPTIYITLPDGKKKRRKVVVKALPRKAPEPDRRAEVSLKNLKRLASIRVELPPVPKINPAEMRQAVRAAFAVSGSVAQTQAPAHQQVTAKESRPDEEMLLLLIA